MARRIRISEEQKQNLKKLRIDIQNSVENAASEESISQFKTTLKTALSDRVITQSEFQAITNDVLKVVESAGVTPEETRVIFYDLQDIAETSRYPRTNDDLKGTDGSDTLWTGLGNDILTGVGAAAGVGEIDQLVGGGGKDTFVLGNSTQVFYDDGKVNTLGLGDYALILDFNVNKDTIQLKGSATDYILSALPESLGLSGTGIYTASRELIGVVSGVTVSDFSAGFAFV